LTRFNHSENGAIPGHNIESLKNVTISGCAAACLDSSRSDWCVSFDYYKNSRKCDLSDQRASDIGGLKTDFSGSPFDYYELRQKSVTRFKHTIDTALSGHHQTRMKNVTVNDCANACINPLKVEWCTSFDYYEDTKECALNYSIDGHYKKTKKGIPDILSDNYRLEA